MSVYTKVSCDRVTEISVNSYKEVELELENVDLGSLLLGLDVETIVRNSDIYAVLDYLDIDMLKEYIAKIWSKYRIAVLSYLGEPTSHEIL